MILDLSSMSPAQVYANMIQSVIPRPIAWVLSENQAGDYNLAPFSYFSAVCSDPPLLMISVGRKPDGSQKDTKVNIEERGEFVIHIVDEDNLDDMNTSSATLPYGQSEVSEIGAELIPFEGSRLPRLKSSRIAFACRRYQTLQLGNGPQNVIFGEVSHIYIDDSIIGEDPKGRLKVLADELRPVGRMGAGEYVSFGEILFRQRPA